ncbi:uncharacterized protein [Euphorbia lathyris]|uniref:uncharacterized protein isoform X2 n=1 Tax=Euphorbia lathyris TaxID=212925 RepID=UPI0033132AE0
MLQWMGGSRRKVTTSRKSIQKRQKQYFEQKRRQQHQHQQTAGLESPEEGKDLKQTNRDHRSLDILNLLNFSTTSKEEKLACPGGREDAKSNASTVKYHAITDPPILRVSTVTTADSLETNQASSPPHCQVENQSPKKFLLDSPDNCRNDYNKINNHLDCLRTESQQQLSLYDLLGDDEANGQFEGTPPVHEAHVAFSVDGLGKVGTKTPPSSPKQSDRFVSYGCFSPLKAARRVHSPRNQSSGLNGLKHEVDAMMQDVEMPLSVGCLDSLTGIEDSYREVMSNSPVVRDCMQLDSQGRKVRSSFFDGKASCNDRSNHEDLWDGRCSFMDTDFLGEPQYDMAWKSRPCHPDNNSADFLKHGNDEMPEYAFESVNLHHKRDASKATERFNYLDSFSPEHQTSDHCYDFTTPRRARHHFGHTSFDFGDVTGCPGCAGFDFEDTRGCSSLLSEESCSSTAVRDEMTDVSLASSRRNNRRHHENAFSRCETNHGEKTFLANENLVKVKDDLHKGRNACWSGNFTEMPVLLDSKSGHNLKFLSEEIIGPSGSLLFEQGYRAADMNLGFSSTCPTMERKGPSTGSRASTEDFLHTSTREPNIDAEFSFGKNWAFSKSPTSGSCISQKCKSYQPASERRCHNSPSSSKAEFWTRKPDISTKSLDCRLESSFTHSSQDAGHRRCHNSPASSKAEFWTRKPDISTKSLNSGLESSFTHSSQDAFSLDSGLESSFTHSSQDVLSHGDTLILSDLPENESVSKSNEYQPETPKVEDKQIKTSKEILIEKNTKAISTSNSKESKETTAKTMLPAKISDKSESSVDGTEHHSGDEVALRCEKENKETEGERKIANKRHSNGPNSSPQIVMLESFVLQLFCVQKVVEAASDSTQ